MEKHIVEEHFSGECLEGFGFPSKGIAVIDKKMKPCVFDIVYCNDCACSVSGYLKQIVRTGEKPIVRTCYKDSAKDFMFFAAEIYGVVICVMDENRNVVWERQKPVEYVPVRHGRWDSSGKYRFQIDNSVAVRCTECGCCLTEPEYRRYTWNYCPVCGARMDGDVDG